jgi:hypothetical protein
VIHEKGVGSVAGFDEAAQVCPFLKGVANELGEAALGNIRTAFETLDLNDPATVDALIGTLALGLFTEESSAKLNSPAETVESTSNISAKDDFIVESIFVESKNSAKVKTVDLVEVLLDKEVGAPLNMEPALLAAISMDPVPFPAHAETNVVAQVAYPDRRSENPLPAELVHQLQTLDPEVPAAVTRIVSEPIVAIHSEPIERPVSDVVIVEPLPESTERHIMDQSEPVWDMAEIAKEAPELFAMSIAELSAEYTDGDTSASGDVTEYATIDVKNVAGELPADPHEIYADFVAQLQAHAETSTAAQTSEVLGLDEAERGGAESGARSLDTKRAEMSPMDLLVSLVAEKLDGAPAQVMEAAIPLVQETVLALQTLQQLRASAADPESISIAEAELEMAIAQLLELLHLPHEPDGIVALMAALEDTEFERVLPSVQYVDLGQDGTREAAAYKGKVTTGLVAIEHEVARLVGKAILQIHHQAMARVRLVSQAASSSTMRRPSVTLAS